MKRIKYDLSNISNSMWSNIDKLIKEAKHLGIKEHVELVTDIKGVILVITPFSDIQERLDFFNKEYHRLTREFCLSDEYRKKSSNKLSLATTDELSEIIKEYDPIFDEMEFLTWFHKYSKFIHENYQYQSFYHGSVYNWVECKKDYGNNKPFHTFMEICYSLMRDNNNINPAMIRDFIDQHTER